MSENIVYKAELRERTGTGGARALRREGLIPGIIYGGQDDPVKIAVSFKEIKLALDHDPRFFSTVVEVDVNGKRERVLPREAQVHPVTDFPLHIDFLRARKGATVVVMVQVNFTNEASSIGLKRGGVLNMVRREVELNCPADNIPGQIDCDLAGFDIGDSIHISHIKLPAGVTPTITDRDFTVASIVPPTVVTESMAAAAQEGGDDEG